MSQNRTDVPPLDASRDRSPVKATIGICSLLLAGTVLFTHQMGQLYPWSQIGATVAVGVILFIGWIRDDVSLETLFVLFVLVSLTYRLYVFAFPVGMIGADADHLVVDTVRVATLGTVDTIDGRFYRNAPLFFVFGAETIILADVPGRWAASIHPFVVGLSFPAAVFVITRRLRIDRTAVIVATALASIAPVSVGMSVTPVPQIFAMGMFVVGMFALLHHYETGSSRSLVLLIGLLFGLMLSHKSLLFEMCTIMGVVLIIAVVNHRSTSGSKSSHMFVLLAITAIILYYQWFSLTVFVRSIIGQSFAAFTSGPEVVTDSSSFLSGTPGIELSIPFRPVRVLYNIGYSIARLPVAGVAWLYLLMAHRRSAPVQIILGGAATTVGFLGVIIVVPTSHNLQRFSIVAEPFLLVLLGVFVSTLVTRHGPSDRKYRRLVRILGIVVLIGLIVSSGLTPALSPDASEKSRKYLTSSEIAGKSFGAVYTTGEIRADPYFNHEIAPPITDERARTQKATYTSMHGALANGSFPQGGYEYVAFRPQIEIYRIGGSYRLTWDPQSTLKREYNRVYDNREVALYRRSNRTPGGGNRG